ncbi:MFS transporter [Chthonobacter albigriseus]|uniref:MFS transporter n=1 Tax=Chthonobacter albigriseus TaxID=1683161 RepID=UPI0015EFA417|nr:MFS transporter [Chthonobacter albigriseus]
MPSARLAIASLSLSMLLSSLGTSIASVALPTLSDAFNVPFQQVQWVVIAYLVVITSFIVSVGRLGDIVGRRRLLLAGLAAFTTASALCAVATSLQALVVFRGIQGLGASVMMALTMALVTEAAPEERTGSAMGLLATTSAVGTALGPSLGGMLIAGWGWPAVFLINVPVGILAFGLASLYLPPDTKAGTSAARFDGLGTVLLASSMAAFALSMTLGRGHFGLLNGALVVGAAGGMVVFLFSQTRVASPLIRLASFQDKGFSAGLAANSLVSTVMMATLVIGPFYLTGALGLREVEVGLVMSIGPIVSACAGVPAGHLVDRYGASRMVPAGLMTMLAGAAAIAELSSPYGLVGYVAGILLLTPGYQLFQAANNTAVLATVAPGERGVRSGMLNLSRNLGLVTGASAMGAIFAITVGTSPAGPGDPNAVTSGMQMTFAVAAALMTVAVALAMFGRIVVQKTAANNVYKASSPDH